MQDSTEQTEPGSIQKPFIEHLEDLRITLLKILGFVVLSVIICIIFSRPLFDILMRPLQSLAKNLNLDPATVGLTVLGPQKGFTIIMATDVVAGCIISVPFTVYFLLQFMLPALTNREKGIFVPAMFISGMLFLCGVAFCYFLTLPLVLQLLWRFNSEVFPFNNMWTVNEYLSMTMKFMIANGIIFEMPIVLIALTQLGIITPETLRKKRKLAVFIIAVASAFLSPPDIASMLMVAAPMLLLYELSVFFAFFLRRRKSS